MKTFAGLKYTIIFAIIFNADVAQLARAADL